MMETTVTETLLEEPVMTEPVMGGNIYGAGELHATESVLLTNRAYVALRVLNFGYLRHDRVDKAQVLLEALNNLMPEDTDILLSLAHVYVKVNRCNDAMSLISTIQKDLVTPGVALHLITIKALLGMDRTAEASEYLQQHHQYRTMT